MRSKELSVLSSAEPVEAGFDFGERSVFTVDVEEWFQVGAFENTICREDWSDLESRVVYQTHKVLELLTKHGVTGTFFCLGWVAERSPELLREIHAAGHELACHGSDHKRLFTMSSDNFFEDVRIAKQKIEDASGVSVIGYRAPSFSLTPETWWVYDSLEKLGFRYSSSVYPLKTDHYGMPDAPTRPFWPIGAGRVLEVPLSVCRSLGRRWPASGGGYFRLLPYAIGKGLLDRSIKQNKVPGVFYMHPWEMDPEQPFRADAPALSRFRHYTGQGRMAAKVGKLCDSRKWGSMTDVFAPLLRGSLEGEGK
ncbi:MAG: DUF3473 domain-containing protein [Alphaproteobacteria bacterium]|nr:DUF3473 domain-containing protein [Alphaproteobacteria bacterium]